VLGHGVPVLVDHMEVRLEARSQLYSTSLSHAADKEDDYFLLELL